MKLFGKRIGDGSNQDRFNKPGAKVDKGKNNEIQEVIMYWTPAKIQDDAPFFD
jgi:hypothetical protein